jgi:hypothetical protein
MSSRNDTITGLIDLYLRKKGYFDKAANISEEAMQAVRSECCESGKRKTDPIDELVGEVLAHLDSDLKAQIEEFTPHPACQGSLIRDSFVRFRQGVLV